MCVGPNDSNPNLTSPLTIPKPPLVAKYSMMSIITGLTTEFRAPFFGFADFH